MKKKLVIILAFVAVFAVAAGGTYILMSRNKAEPAAAQKEKKRAETLATFHMNDITTNLADQGVRRYIMVDIALGLASEDVAKKMEKDSSAVKDAIIAVLRSKTYDQVSGPNGYLSLKKDLRGRINQVLGSDEVKEVYFNKFVVE